MVMNNFVQEINYVRLAADAIGAVSNKHSLGIKHTQCYELVAAYLGYASKAALDADMNPCASDLHLVRPDHNMLASRIQQICGLSSQFLLGNLENLVQMIRVQLSPACIETGIKNPANIPVGRGSMYYASEVWIHPSRVGFGGQYGYCRCCGRDVAYSVENLDHQSLCSDHGGEFDMSPEEREDWDSYAENIRNNY